MFWGLIMEPQRRYAQKVKKSFHISMAAIDVSTSSNEPAQVMCGFEGRNYLLCTLKKPEVLQCPLDLNFEVGSEVSFMANGRCHIHLTGYLNDELEDLEDGEEEEEEVVEDEETTRKSKKRTKKVIESGLPSKKQKNGVTSSQNQDDNDEDDSDSDSVTDLSYVKKLLGRSLDDDDEDSDAYIEEEAEEGEEEEEAEEGEEEDEDEEEEVDLEGEEESSMSEEDELEVTTKINGLTSSKANTAETQQKKKGKNKEKQVENDKKSPQPKNESKKEAKKSLQGGVIIEEIREGQGALAKNGKFVNVYYEGRLKQNNKMFDSTTKGTGFRFRLGGGEVIKGWDIGVAGMKVGGKRRITCPPAMAYGHKGSPPAIPANSTLVFEVELKKVN